MKASQLRASILQQAVEGKLVPQIPEEGTAADLLESIRAEREALIKAGKIKKAKPLPKITEDEIPFEIPETWEWVRFFSVVNIATNLVNPESYPDYMHIAPDNIEKSTGVLLECHSVRQDNVVSANHLFYKGQIIYSKIRPLLRKAVIAPFDGLCSADMYPLNTSINREFLLRYILSDAFNIQVATVMSSRVKMPKINQEELSNILLPLPPLAEQKRIVAKLEELMPLIDAYEKEEEKLSALEKSLPEKLRRSVLQQAVEGKLVPQRAEEGTAAELLKEIEKERAELVKAGKMKKAKPLPEISEEEIPFEIPESWEWVRLAQLGEIIGGGTPDSSNRNYWTDGTIPWLTPADMKYIGKYVSRGERNITELGLQKSSAVLLPKFSVIYSSRAPIGYVSITKNELSTNQGFKSLSPYNSEISEYIYYCLINRTPDIQERATGTTFKEISGFKFGLTLIPLPPLAEQKRIVAKVEELMQIIDKL